MPVLRNVGKAVNLSLRGGRVAARGVRKTAAGTTRAGRWVARNARVARQHGGQRNPGMMRLLDLHAISCAGDTLVTIGLAGTIFFNVPAGEARGRVALYLLITMVPFALLAPVVGPVLDRFRHGRRYALALTMLGRAFFAWVIADNTTGIGLYPAAFGVLALSRAYGVARSAAVPRLLPPGLGLSEAGARASVYGTVAGFIVAPLGAAAVSIGTQWPLRVASVIFLVGAFIALALPPRADSDPPEVVPKIFQVPWRHRIENGEKVLSGPLVIATLFGATSLRALYGFLLLFLAFAVRAGELPTEILGVHPGQPTALALAAGALVAGQFIATAIGTKLRIRRPVRLQASALIVVAVLAIYATIRFSLSAVVLLCLSAAIATGLAKLSVDAVIQERVPEHVRASAFAHSETMLMLAWVLGGGIGLIPFGGRWGIAVAAVGVAAAAVKSGSYAWRLRADRLAGRAGSTTPATPPPATPRQKAATTKPVRGKAKQPVPVAGPAQPAPAATKTETDQEDESPPGFHIFRPSPPDAPPPEIRG